MAVVTRGKLKGRTVKIVQFCNDWFSIETNGCTKIISPLSLCLNNEEFSRVIKARDVGDVGNMFQQFLLRADGTFIRKR